MTTSGGDFTALLVTSQHHDHQQALAHAGHGAHVHALRARPLRHAWNRTLAVLIAGMARLRVQEAAPAPASRRVARPAH